MSTISSNEQLLLISYINNLKYIKLESKSKILNIINKQDAWINTDIESNTSTSSVNSITNSNTNSNINTNSNTNTNTTTECNYETSDSNSTPLILNPNNPTEQDSMVIDYLVNQEKYVLFMKGNPDKPRCKFSRKMRDILNNNNIIFTHFDVLSERSVRDAIKIYSNFPTYPQLFKDGKLIGGIDIVESMVADGITI